MHKISFLGFHKNVVNWIQNFLNSRTFQVRDNSTFSIAKPVISRAPQGGVLSPVLFNIYVADIQNLLETNDVSCKQYADDLKIYRQIENSEDMELLQRAIGRLARWADEWQLLLSHAKTFHLRLGCSEHSSAYSIQNSLIATVSEVKDLGFLYNTSL